MNMKTDVSWDLTRCSPVDVTILLEAPAADICTFLQDICTWYTCFWKCIFTDVQLIAPQVKPQQQAVMSTGPSPIGHPGPLSPPPFNSSSAQPGHINYQVTVEHPTLCWLDNMQGEKLYISCHCAGRGDCEKRHDTGNEGRIEQLV
jgi:hypothetical protein